jgi:hypothetical protein
VEHSTPCRREYDGTAHALSVSSANVIATKTANAAMVRGRKPADGGSLVFGIFISFPLAKT